MHTHDEEARNFLGILVSIVYWLPTMLATNLAFSSSKYVCFLFRVLFFSSRMCESCASLY
jgi:hypothetical protein